MFWIVKKLQESDVLQCQYWACHLVKLSLMWVSTRLLALHLVFFIMLIINKLIIKLFIYTSRGFLVIPVVILLNVKLVSINI